MEHQNEYRSLCNRLIRKGLFVGCLAITFLHWRVRFPSTAFNKTYSLHGWWLQSWWSSVFGIGSNFPWGQCVGAQLLSSLTRAYASTVLVMTRIFALTVPALIAFSLIQTSPIRPISVAAHENWSVRKCSLVASVGDSSSDINSNPFVLERALQRTILLTIVPFWDFLESKLPDSPLHWHWRCPRNEMRCQWLWTS